MAACNTCGKMGCYEHGGEIKYKNPELAKKGLAELKAKHKELTPEQLERNKMQDQFMRNTGGEPMSIEMPRKKMAEGGEVEDQGDDMSGVNDELMDMACDELIKALESKNKKEILESIKAIVLNCME